MSYFQANIQKMKIDIGTIRIKKRQKLENLELLILDNSIRESSVGQLRGHTLENKKAIYEQVKQCGINLMIVALLEETPSVDDDFCQWLKDQNEDFSQFVSFSEISTGLKNGVYDTEIIPCGMLKNKEYGLYNVMFEIDLADAECE